MKIYTDGACSQNGTWNGGWGVVVVENGSYYSFGGNEKETTNNRMELKAFLEALKIAATSPILPTIYTDSAYITNAFHQNWIANWRRNGWRNSKKQPVANQDLWRAIVELFDENPHVKIVKVKGHAGDKYNEIADQVAVEWRDKL